MFIIDIVLGFGDDLDMGIGMVRVLGWLENGLVLFWVGYDNEDGGIFKVYRRDWGEFALMGAVGEELMRWCRDGCWKLMDEIGTTIKGQLVMFGSRCWKECIIMVFVQVYFFMKEHMSKSYDFLCVLIVTPIAFEWDGIANRYARKWSWIKFSAST